MPRRNGNERKASTSRKHITDVWTNHACLRQPIITASKTHGGLCYSDILVRESRREVCACVYRDVHKSVCVRRERKGASGD